MKEKDILSKLYDYQLAAVDATDKNDKGIVCMPTGTGKTFVQASVIAKEILKSKGKFGIYVINAPRIMLSYQLLKEVYSFLTYAGIDARYMSVHSGGSNDMEDFYTTIVKNQKVETSSTKAVSFSFKNEIDANNFLKYLKTYFCRFCLSICKNSSDLNKIDFSMIPKMDFSKEWTDEKLYKHFNITEEEIIFIENNIPKYY